MGKIKRYKNRVEKFLSGESGQRFFNFAYSIGAAVVIWGALFKILHLPGGNMLLSIGMGTEVLMFILTAFDRPAREYHWEEVFPVLQSKNPDDRPDFNGSGSGIIINGAPGKGDSTQGDAVISGGTITVGGGAMPETIGYGDDVAGATQQYLSQIASIATEMERLRETTNALNTVSETLLTSYRAITENSESITASSAGYVDQMQALNRNIAGLNTIYEIQLKSVSSQLDAIDRVNRGIKEIRDMYESSSAKSAMYCEETEKMARNMQKLNKVYEQVLRAMTINMAGAMPGAMAPQAPAPEAKSDSDTLTD